MTQYLAVHEDKTGSDFGGSDGATNRTLTLSNTNAIIPLFTLKVQGSILMYGDDFTLSSGVITILTPLFNDQSVDIDYLTTSTIPTATTSTLKYATTQQLAAVLNISSEIPSWSVGSTPSQENVGTGDNTTLVFYLDHNNVLADSYTLYYGTSTLTETTHYTLDKDKGKITLTTAGRTLVGTSIIYAEYSYINVNLKDSYLQTVLLRAEKIVDNSLGTTFTDGTQDNPDYPLITGEYHSSKGLFNRTYWTLGKPVIDITSTLLSDITSSDITLSVASGDGSNYPTSGILQIGSEIITYTGLTTDTFTGLGRGAYGSTASSHSASDDVHTVSIQISGTDEGGTPTWYTLTHDSEVSVDENGKIYIYEDTLYTNLSTGNNLLYKQDVAKRLRAYYLYGWDTIPVDITRLTLLIAQRMLLNDTITGSLFKGRNEFRPETIEVLDKEINSISNTYAYLDMNNT